LIWRFLLTRKFLSIPRNLNFKNMSSISILSYVILTLSIGYAFVYPSIGDLSALIEEKQKYNESLEMVNNIENRKNELLTKFNSIPAADRKDIETILPDSLNFVKLVSQIDAVAASHGILIDRISSREIDSSSGGSIEETGSQKPYESSVIGFSFDASYDRFNAFMNDLEKSQRILDIKSIRLATKEDGTYSYNVEFEAHWLKPL